MAPRSPAIPARLYSRSPALLAAALLLLSAPATARQAVAPSFPGAAPAKPGAARRVVQVFDFEEPFDPADPNPDPVPRFWFRAQDPPADRPPVQGGGARERGAFPAWNEAAFDTAVAFSGRASVRLPASGGSTALRLRAGAIPVFPGADYTVTAMVRTERAAGARAFLTARLLDGGNPPRPIPGAEVRSAPTATAGDWTRVAIDVPGVAPGAAFLQIDLELLQPRRFGGSPTDAPLGRHAVWIDDIDAAAWFDDVTVEQSPRTELTTDAAAAGNIFVAPERPALRFVVRDMVGDALTALLTVRDADGRAVASHAVAVDGRTAGGGNADAWTPDLSALGPYTATLDIFSGPVPPALIGPERPDGPDAPGPIARVSTAFLWLPADASSRTAPAAAPAPAGAAGEARRFGLIVEHAPPPGGPGGGPWPAFLPGAVRRLHTGFLTLPAWIAADTPETIARRLADSDATGPHGQGVGGHARSVIDDLLDADQALTLALTTVPDALARDLRVDPADPLALAGREQDAWRPYLLPLLDRHGQRILRWQVGAIPPAPRSPGAFWHAGLAGEIATCRALLAGLVPGPVLTIPWRADQALPVTGAPDAVTLLFPASFAPDAVRQLGADLAGERKTTEVTLALEPRSSASTVPRASAEDLVKKAVEFWALTGAGGPGPPSRLALVGPWDFDPGPGAQPLPTAALAAWRTLADHLANRRVVGELKVVPRSMSSGASPGLNRAARSTGGRVRCLILAPTRADTPGATGALVAWNESAEPEDAVLRAYLGEGPLSMIDLFGNRTPVAPAQRRRGEGPAHEIQIPSSPVFIEGIDPAVTRFISSFSVDPPAVESITTEHEVHLVLTNPWNVRITGDVQLLRPADGQSGWTVSPRGPVPFSIAPGETERVPVSFSFGPSEEAAAKPFVALARLSADRPYPALELRTTLELGLKDLDLVADTALSPGAAGPDVTVTATVTNRGRLPRTLRLDAAAPGLATQQLPISDVQPGETVVRRFVFPGAAASLAGKRIRLSLADVDTPERLNTSARVP